MNLPNEIVVAAVLSLVSLQVWQVRQIFAIKQHLAVLANREQPSRHSLMLLLFLTAAPWAALFLTGCTPLDNALLKRVPPAPDAETNAPVLLVPRPEIEAGISSAQQVVAFAPSPYREAAEFALGGLSGLLALYARKRSLAATSATAQLTAVVKGVEQLPDTQAAPAKRAILQQAVRDRIALELHRTVKAVTDALPPVVPVSAS